MDLHGNVDLFVCRECARLQYASKMLRDPIRLMHHYGRLRQYLARPGRPSPGYKDTVLRDVMVGFQVVRHLVVGVDRMEARRAKRQAQAMEEARRLIGGKRRSPGHQAEIQRRIVGHRGARGNRVTGETMNDGMKP
jgi:hypothetical protein